LLYWNVEAGHLERVSEQNVRLEQSVQFSVPRESDTSVFAAFFCAFACIIPCAKTIPTVATNPNIFSIVELATKCRS